jgi:hypothetical protein
MLSCYHVQEEALDEDDLRDIHIEEAKGEREVEGSPIELEVIFAPIKVNKVNIGTLENPKWLALEITGMNKQ